MVETRYREREAGNMSKREEREKETERERAVESKRIEMFHDRKMRARVECPKNAIVFVHCFTTWKVHEGKVHDYVNDK